jgi:hypothetical protein
VALSVIKLGAIALLRGDLSSAERRHQEALQILRELCARLGTPGARRELAFCLIGLGCIARERGDESAAEHWFREERRIARELGED